MSISRRAVDLAHSAANAALPATRRSMPERVNRITRALLAPEVERAMIAGKDGEALIAEAHAARIVTEIERRWRRLGNYQRLTVTAVIASALTQAYQIGRDERLQQRTSADNGGET